MDNEELIQQLKSSFPSHLKSISEEDAKNAIIYGINCYTIEDSKPLKGSLFLSLNEDNIICFADISNEKIKSINIQNIEKISFDINHKDIIKYKKKNKDEKFIEIIMITQKDFIFYFDNFEKLLFLIKGMILICDQYKKINIDNNNVLIRKKSGVNLEMDKILNKYDTNFDNIFNKNELDNFCKDNGIPFSLLMKDLALDNNKIITKDNLRKYLEKKFYRGIYKDFVHEYSNSRETLNYEELINFFKKEQKEDINEIDAIILIIKFNLSINDNVIRQKLLYEIEKSYLRNKFKFDMKEIILICKKYNFDEKILEMKLCDFNNMLNSNLLSIYNHNLFESVLDLNHPLTDYLINSTHNTYLTGNQLYGKSDAKMYAYAVLTGYRFLELDCYNGEGDNIEVTHGFTLTTKINFVDALIEIKENAFINSPLPLIISIENHLDYYHQKVLAKNIKDILQNLYIVPRDKKPNFIPMLKDLIFKFIIETEGEKIWPLEEIPLKKIDKKPIDSISKNSIRNKIKKIVLKNIEKDDIFDDFNFKGINYTKTEEILLYQNKLKENILNVNKNKNFNINPAIHYEFGYIDEPKGDIIDDDYYYKNNNISENINVIKEINLDLENIRGLITCDYDENKINELNYYKHINFCKFRCSKYLDFYYNEEMMKKMVQLSQHCVIKSYPVSFNSYNFDVIKTWLAGCQCACLNIQKSDDDFLLYNKVFFRQNYNYGYVLRPNELLYNTNNNLDKNMKPKFNLICKIFSIFNLVKLLEISEINIIENEDAIDFGLIIYSIGNKNDDAFNPVNIKLNGSLYFPFISQEENIIIPIYESILGALMIKIIYKGNVIGKGCIPYNFMKEGFRRIPIYDKNLCICKDTFIVGRFHKLKYKLNTEFQS